MQNLVEKTPCILHVIDSERAEDDVPLSAFDRVLSLSEEGESGLLTVITLPVRRGDFEERFAETLEVLRSHWSGGLCLVAGNPAYLSGEEISKPAGHLLEAAVAAARRSIGSGLLMVGTENVLRPAVKAARKWRAIPFALLNGNSPDEIRWLSQETTMPVAVYAPLHIGSKMSEEAERRLTTYALRRKNQTPNPDRRGLRRLVSQVALLGSPTTVRRRVYQLAQAGASIIIGFPVDDEQRQLETFVKAF